MAPSTPSTPHGRGGSESGSPAPSFAAPGSYTLEDVVPGVKIFVLKPLPTGTSEQRKAEILSTRPKPPRSAFAPAPPPGAPPPDPRDDTEYYVHYVEFNKRLDEWVGGSRLVTEKEMEWPRPKEEEKKGKRGAVGKATPGIGTGSGTPGHGAGHTPLGRKGTGAGTPTPSGSLLRKAANKAAAAAVAVAGQGMKTPAKSTKSTPGKGNKTPARRIGGGGAGGGAGMGKGAEAAVKLEPEDASPDGTTDVGDDDDADGEADADADVDMDADADADGSGDFSGDFSLSSRRTDSPDGEIDLTLPSDPKAAPRVFSKKQEIEKLRTSGSMTQSHSEVSRVKNLNRIQMGKHTFETWYFSPYPKEYAHLDVLYLCEFCLLYYPSETQLGRHRTKCTLFHPPGNEIYRHDGISYWEIDGRRQRTWCRNLCLLSKCFLDHKTLYYDVDPFMYYCMTIKDEYGCHLIGYFSKEKESAENYNVACILTLPQFQRKGYGRLLIEFSYELSLKEAKLGSPEKPLSDLGLLGYRAYWQEKIVQMLLSPEMGEGVTIDEIAAATAITHSDVTHTLQALQMVKYHKTGHVLHITDAVMEQHEKTMRKARKTIDRDSIQWKPPVFSRAQLAFGY